MARVARTAGRRGRTIPARLRPGPTTHGDAPLARFVVRPWTLGSGTRQVPEVRGESGQVRRTAAILAAGALVFLAGCQGDQSGGSQATAEKATPAKVSLAVADGSTDISPVEPLQIAVTGGKLRDVTVVDGHGTKVDGSVEPDAAQDGSSVWTPQDKLAYGTKYTLSAKAKNTAGDETKAASTFTTVTPASVSTPSIGPLDGTTVGVGMPIRVYFDDPVADKAAVESHLKVTSSA